MSYEYFYNQEPEQYVHYQMPTILFEDERLKELSINAKFLYSLLLDRAKLSYKNGWLDSDGKVYIHYAQSDLMQLLNCGRTKVSEYLKELDGNKGGVGLIEREQKVGIGKSDKIYVKNFAHPIADESEKSHFTDTNIPFEYFHDMESMRFSHYQVPKMLFLDERIKNISNTAKMAYCFLLDRTALSYKNGWKDKDGRIYVIFPQNELQKLLGCSERTVREALNELDLKKGIGLIDRTRQGMNNPDMIYVLDYSTGLKYAKAPKNNVETVDNQGMQSTVNIGPAKSEHQDRQNLNIGPAKSEHRDRQNLNIGPAKSEHLLINNININNTDFNNTQSVSLNATTENFSTISTDRQTDGQKRNKMAFTEILTAIGVEWYNHMSYEPKSEQDFKDRDEEIRKTKSCTLPYNLKSDKKAMEEALKFLFAYSHYANDIPEQSQRLMSMVISSITDMAVKDKQKLDKNVVSGNDIIDRINCIIQNDYLIDWFFSFEQKWEKIISENEIRNHTAYLKSCIWNWLNEYRFVEDNNIRSFETNYKKR